MRVLEEAADIVKRKWRTTRTGWKVFLAVIIVLAGITGLIMFSLLLFVKFLKALSVGGTRNLDLYFPRTRR